MASVGKGKSHDLFAPLLSLAGVAMWGGGRKNKCTILFLFLLFFPLLLLWGKGKAYFRSVSVCIFFRAGGDRRSKGQPGETRRARPRVPKRAWTAPRGGGGEERKGERPSERVPLLLAKSNRIGAGERRGPTRGSPTEVRSGQGGFLNTRREGSYLPSRACRT